jgi:hypothetical protein
MPVITEIDPQKKVERLNVPSSQKERERQGARTTERENRAIATILLIFVALKLARENVMKDLQAPQV